MDHGFICKKCDGPAPVGIGYTDYSPGAAERSATRVSCPCGYSVKDETPTAGQGDEGEEQISKTNSAANRTGLIRVHCQGGITLKGKTIDTIGRREFGPKAIFRESQNPNDIAVGKFLIPTAADPRAYWVGAIVLQIEEVES